MKLLTGKVISTKTKNTALIVVDSFVRHKVYGKILKKSKKYQADTNNLEVKEGDLVTLISSRPISKDKNWKIETIIK